MPPFQDEYVVCPRCEARIKKLVIEGDPGYIIGADPDGAPSFFPPGQFQAAPGKLSAAERDAKIAQVNERSGRRSVRMAIPRNR